MTDYFADRELDGIFDDINPADFAPHRGQVAFDSFVARNVEMVRYAWLACGGNLTNPVAILATATEQHSFIPTSTESLGDFVQRLKVEAGKLGASWLFISRLTAVGVQIIDHVDQLRDTGVGEHVTEVNGVPLAEGVYYYAARLENGTRFHRHGIMTPDADDRLQEPTEGNPHQTAELLDSILF